MPNTVEKRHIFKLHTSRMTLAPDVNLEELIGGKDEISGADIASICSKSISLISSGYCQAYIPAEAGMLALRERRMMVSMADLLAGRDRVNQTKQENLVSSLESPFALKLTGKAGWPVPLVSRYAKFSSLRVPTEWYHFQSRVLCRPLRHHHMICLPPDIWPRQRGLQLAFR
jgi:hypothetical protein